MLSIFPLNVSRHVETMNSKAIAREWKPGKLLSAIHWFNVQCFLRECFCPGIFPAHPLPCPSIEKLTLRSRGAYIRTPTSIRPVWDVVFSTSSVLNSCVMVDNCLQSENLALVFLRTCHLNDCLWECWVKSDGLDRQVAVWSVSGTATQCWGCNLWKPFGQHSSKQMC